MTSGAPASSGREAELDDLAARLQKQVKKPVKYEPLHRPQGPPDPKGAASAFAAMLPWWLSIPVGSALLVRRAWRRRRGRHGRLS